MAKLKKKDLDKIKFVGVGDLFNNMDKYESFDDKLKYATRYLLSYNLFSNQKDSRVKAMLGKEMSYGAIVEAVRMKLVEEGKKQADPNKKAPDHFINKGAKNEKDDIAAELFVSQPDLYLKGEGEKLLKEIDEEDINYQWQNELKENVQNLLPKFDDKFTAQQHEFDKKPSWFGVKSKMEQSLGGKEGVEAVIQGTKPKGLFGRIFDTSSAEWHALENAYGVFNNPLYEGFGNMDYLEENAVDYLKHKFPKWEKGQEIPAEAYSKLNDTELAKVNFTVSVLNAIDEQRETEKTYRPTVDAARDKKLEYSNIPEPEDHHKVIELENEKFQNELKDDIEEENLDSEVEIEEEEDEVERDQDLNNDDFYKDSIN